MEGLDTRTKVLIGEEGIDALRNAFIILAGAGAVGGYALEGLVRSGVGHIRVIDGDVFSGSNLNRQILATSDTLGRRKAEVAVERARSINPDIDIEGIPSLITKDGLDELLKGNPDVVVDAIDTVEHKVALLRYAAEHDMRVFSSMGAALHMDTQSVRIAPLKKTKVCPLASAVRSRLRDVDTSNITAVYSEEQPLVTPNERDDHGKSVLGSLSTLPAIFGMTLANETIRYIISRS